MRKHSPFSLYLRRGVWHARFWDEQRLRYCVTRSTGLANRDEAVVAAARMIEDGSVQHRSADPALIGSRGGQLAFQSVTVPSSHAFATGTIGRDLTRRLEKPEYTLHPLGALTLEEIRKVIELTFKDLRQKTVVLLGRLPGLRRGEMRALTWRQVDFEKHEINVGVNFTDVDGLHAPKSLSAVPVPMIKQLEDTLKALRCRRCLVGPDDFVLANSYTLGAPMSNTVIDLAFKSVLDAIGVDVEARKKRHFTTHSMRHTSKEMMRRDSDALTIDRAEARKKLRVGITAS